MASIIGLNEQKQALKQISATIKDIELANEFLSASNPSNEYVISFVDASGKKYATDVIVPQKGDIDQLIYFHKVMVRDYVMKLATEHHIKLDERDTSILGIE